MKAQIVLLKTKDKSAPIWIEEMGENTRHIREVIHNSRSCSNPDNVLGYSARRHIHLTSDEPLVTGHYVFCYSVHLNNPYHPEDRYINPVRRWGSGTCTACKKIVASTDESLGLPTISKEWIRDVFIPANGKLTEVNLEMVKCFNCDDKSKCIYCENNICERPSHVKLINNEVCIVSPGGIIGERKSYTHEDFDRDVKEQQTLETAAREAAKSGGPFSTHGQNYEYMFKLGAEWQKQQKPPRQLTTYDRDGY